APASVPVAQRHHVGRQALGRARLGYAVHDGTKAGRPARRPRPEVTATVTRSAAATVTIRSGDAWPGNCDRPRLGHSEPRRATGRCVPTSNEGNAPAGLARAPGRSVDVAHRHVEQVEVVVDAQVRGVLNAHTKFPLPARVEWTDGDAGVEHEQPRSQG